MQLDPPQPACPLCGGSIRHWAAKSRRGQSYNYDRCVACGFVFVNPRPTMAALGQHYSSPILDATDTVPTPAAVVPGAQRDIGAWPAQVMEKFLALRPAGARAKEDPHPSPPPSTSSGLAPEYRERGNNGGRMLDIGAADGAYCIAALRRGLSVTALELDPVDLPSLRAAAEIRIVEALFENFDAPPESFDYILMSHVLEHVHDPKLWIEKSARLLTRGGVLAVMLPHFDSLWRYLWKTGDPYFIPPDHLNHFTSRSLGRLCESYGLRTAISYTDTHLPPDVLIRRLNPPRAMEPAICALTRAASFTLDLTTRVLGIGAVLVHYAVKQ